MALEVVHIAEAVVVSVVVIVVVVVAVDSVAMLVSAAHVGTHHAKSPHRLPWMKLNNVDHHTSACGFPSPGVILETREAIFPPSFYCWSELRHDVDGNQVVLGSGLYCPIQVALQLRELRALLPHLGIGNSAFNGHRPCQYVLTKANYRDEPFQ